MSPSRHNGINVEEHPLLFSPFLPPARFPPCLCPRLYASTRNQKQSPSLFHLPTFCHTISLSSFASKYICPTLTARIGHFLQSLNAEPISSLSLLAVQHCLGCHPSTCPPPLCTSPGPSVFCCQLCLQQLALWYTTGTWRRPIPSTSLPSSTNISHGQVLRLPANAP